MVVVLCVAAVVAAVQDRVSTVQVCIAAEQFAGATHAFPLHTCEDGQERSSVCLMVPSERRQCLTRLVCSSLQVKLVSHTHLSHLLYLS